MKILRMLFVAAMLIFLSACKTVDPLDAVHSENTIRLLIAKDDADSMAAAALLSPVVADRKSLIEQATSKAPNRPDLVWLQLSWCQQTAGCNPALLEKHLHEIDPENGVVWFAALHRASNEGDRTHLLENIAASQRIDLYWSTLIGNLSEATLEVLNANAHRGKHVTAEALVGTLGAIAAMAVPAFHDVANACKSEALQNIDRRTQCGGIAQALERGDTIIAESIGLRIEENLSAPDSDAHQQAARRYRIMRYQLSTAGKLANHFSNEQWASDYLKVFKSHRRERDVQLELIKRAELPIEPPLDWKE